MQRRDVLKPGALSAIGAGHAGRQGMSDGSRGLPCARMQRFEPGYPAIAG